MREFDYMAPQDLDEAIALLEPSSRPLAGGTDLLTLMKGDIVAPQRLVNIKRLDAMSGISEEAGGIRIGALTPLSTIENDPAIRETWPALSEAASVAATVQIRNHATIAGNVLQRPRCWYYRASHIDCWLKGGDTCPLRTGENRFGAIFDDSPCSAVHPSDLAPVLIALDARASVRGAEGEHEIAVEDLLQPPGERRREDVLGEQDLITSIWLPRPPDGTRMTYAKAMDRKVWAFALVSVAISLQFREGAIHNPRIVLGGVANTPRRASAAEALLNGATLTSDLASAVAEQCFEGATPLSQNGYKLRLGKPIVSGALQQLSP